MSIIQADRLSAFTGDVIRPGDDEYAQAARTALTTASPALVLRPATTDEVACAVRFAGASELPLAVRGGGHSAAGFGSVDGGVVIDLARLNGVEMLDERRVRVGGGARWRDVMGVLAPLGLLISSGDTADVGVGGLTLSGGIGWAVRRDGLALDRLRAVELVTASGDIVRADATTRPELFWAVRGGGGAFGIVTAFEFEAAEGGSVDVITATWPADDVVRVALDWARLLRTAPDEMSSTLTIADPLSGGRDAPVRATVVAMPGADAASVAIALSGIGAPLTVDLERRPYAEILHDGQHLPAGLGAAVRAHFVPAESADAAIAEVAALARAEHPLPFTLHALGGAFGRVAEDATAFSHRDAELLITTFSVAPTAALETVRAAQESAWRRLAPHTAGAYANSLDGVSAEAVAEAYRDSARTRLAQVRAEFDPQGRFSRNFGPAGTLAADRKERA